MIHGVIMVGGSGTRLWPVSRAKRPKQTMRIGGEDTLLGGSWKRARALAGADGSAVFVATAPLAGVIRAHIPDLPEGALVLEPEGRDTAACVGLAALHVRSRDPDGVMVVMPADHLISPTDAFVAAARAAAAVADRERCLVSVGLAPRHAATGYGYVHRGPALEGTFERPAYRVRRFKEKPDEATARMYFESGQYYWNSGIFAWRADVILEEMARHLPEHHARLAEIAPVVGTPREAEVAARVYPGIPKISIDFGVLEKAAAVCVVEADFSWDDVGCWTAYSQHLNRDGDGNTVDGEFACLDSAGNIVVAPKGKLVSAVGLVDHVVIDTEDALFICPRSRDQDVKKIVEKLKELGREDLL